MKAATDREIGHELTIDISIHAAREGGDYQVKYPATISNISIHAAREGGDGCLQRHAANKCISIHAAREGGDLKVALLEPVQIAFQSTPPVKAATMSIKQAEYLRKYFNPRRP